MNSALSANIWFGPQASTVAPSVDGLYNFLVWISAFFFAVIVFGTIYLAWKYREREGSKPTPSPSHNTKIEVIWSVIPGILCAAIFWYGFEVYMDLKVVPRNAYTVEVEAYKWGWNFKYANGGQSNELHVMAGTPVKLVMTSKDVIHSLWVPDFRTKQDCVPGRYSELWFEAPEAGEHPLFCTEYCGKDHSNMKTKVVVHDDPAAFAKKLREFADLFIDPDNPDQRRTHAQVGEILYGRNCKSCHGNAAGADVSLAPNFYGIRMGDKRKLSDGTEVVYDENYIQNSIWNPGSQYAAGYENAGAMPSFQGQLSAEYVKAMIAYIKQINGQQ